MKKLLIITPHLSTGGCPQVVANKIDLLKDTYEIKCVEYSNIAPLFKVQKDRIKQLIGENNLIILGEDKNELLSLIEIFNPDFISLEEIPEFFMGESIIRKIYSNERSYIITETTHDSSFPVERKRWFPDKFIFVSAYSAFKYSAYDVPYEIIEYPVDVKEQNTFENQNKLGFPQDFKHVVNVGLFTERKNQKYLFEIAKKLESYKILFHFIGNLAGNFENYWKPLLDNKPTNCLVWGERNDVDSFLESSDLFFFASKGNRDNKELNPIAIKEALEYNMPMMMYNLDVYCGKYDEYKNITYLTGDIDTDTKNLLKILNMDQTQENFSLSFEPRENKLFINYNGNKPVNYKVSVRDITSKVPMYWFNFKTETNITWFVIPIPVHVHQFHMNPTFRGFTVEFYDNDNVMRFSKDYVVNHIAPDYPLFNFNPFDCNFRNYNEFFVDDIYRNFNLNKLDTVIDIGANIGLFAKYMFGKESKKVILVEANPLLENNIKNILGEDNKNSSIYLSPIHSENKIVTFRYTENNSAIGSIVFDSENNELYSELDKSLELRTITLQDIIENENLSEISLLKCDIEGGEYDFIPSLTDTQMKMIKRFMIEFHNNVDGKIDLILDKLKSHDFNYYIYTPTINSMKLSDKTINYGMIVTF